jgi:chromosome segregation ATPase
LNLKTNVERLTTLCESLDQSKEELMNKLQNWNQEKRHEESSRGELLQEIQNLKKVINVKETEISDLKSSIKKLDSHIDQL